MLLRFLEFSLDLDLFELRRGSALISADRKAIDLIIFLAENHARVVSRREILREVWPNVVVDDHALSQALYQARRALGESHESPRILKTVRGRGIRFIADVTEVPRPSIVSTAGGRFIGRNFALQQFENCLLEAAQGRGQLLLVCGEPGIGKTRLCEEFLDRSAARGFVAGLGRCAGVGAGSELAPWKQLLGMLRANAGSPLWQLATDDLGALPHLPAEPKRAPVRLVSSDESGSARLRLFNDVSCVVERLAMDAPVVGVIDDIHEIDPSSWELLRFIAWNLSRTPIVLAITYRTNDLTQRPEIAGQLAEMARRASGAAIELAGFSLEEVRDFVNSFSGTSPSKDSLQQLFDRSGGNPFFLSHLVRLGNARDGGMGARKIPSSLVEAIVQQLGAASIGERQLLAMAALMGRDFRVGVLAKGLSSTVQDVLDVLGPLCEAGIVRKMDGVAVMGFRHGLVHEALLARIRSSEVPAIHLAIARAYEETRDATNGEFISELAHHFLSASVLGCEDTAYHYCKLAGDASMESLAFEDAARWYEHCLKLVKRTSTAPADRCQIMLCLGVSLVRAGRREEARNVLRDTAEFAESSNCAAELAGAALGLAPGFFSIEAGVVDQLAVSMLERSLGACVERGSVSAQVMARLAMALQWDEKCRTRSKELALRAAEVAEECDGFETRAVVRMALITTTWSPENVRERIELSRGLISLSGQGKLHELSLIGRVFLISSLLEEGEISAVEQAIRDLFRTIASSHMSHAAWYEPLYRCMLAMQRGEFAAAEELADEVLSMGMRFGDRNAESSFSAIVASIRWHQGRFEEVIPGLSDYSQRFPTMPVWRCALAMVCAAAGDYVEGMLHLQALASDECSAIPRDMMWLTAVCQLCDACSRLGDRSRATMFRRLLEPYRNRFVSVGYGAIGWGSVARRLGMMASLLADWPSAEGYFERAREVDSRAGSATWLSYTELANSEMLLARGRSRDARRAYDLACAARKLAEPRGMLAVSRRADQAVERATIRMGSGA